MFCSIAIAIFAVALVGCNTTEDDYIDPRPQFDAQGNPNFDIHGNHVGCHGIGCSVDDPSMFETSANFYTHGNQIYDSDDNYAGCHGVGCLVDDPAEAGPMATGVSPGTNSWFRPWPISIGPTRTEPAGLNSRPSPFLICRLGRPA